MRVFAVLPVLALVFFVMPRAQAQGAGEFSSVDLQGIGQSADGMAMWALLSFDLEDGWKTYWRNPGDAGIAPHFDWSGSINLKSARIHWPAPKRFFDGYAHSIGYDSPGVVLPIEIEPADPSRPVALSLLLNYAVCERICVPEQVELSGFVRPRPGSRAGMATLRRVRETVPVRTRAPVAGPRVVSAALTVDRETLSVGVVDISAEMDLFAEGPSGEPMLLSKKLEDDGRFSVPLDGIAMPDRAPGRLFVFTLVWPGGALEQPVAITQE